MPRIIGEIEPFPGASEAEVQQIMSDTCAIKSQEIIMKSFGIPADEFNLTNEAFVKGYYAPGEGTYPENVGRLLNDHGIATHTETSANIYDLMDELAKGHKVIVGVDADELWNPSFANKVADFFSETPNHALIVTGIDTSDPNDIKVILTDPGSGDVAKVYSVDDFMDAWQDSDCFFVATEEAPPSQFDPGMINFDYDLGHIPYVAGMDFDLFSNYLVPEMDIFLNDIRFDAESIQAENVYNHMNNIFNAFSEGGFDSNDFNQQLHDMLHDFSGKIDADVCDIVDFA